MEKKKKVPTTKTKKPTMTDKVKGAVEKAIGIVEGKPGKKVRCNVSFWAAGLLNGIPQIWSERKLIVYMQGAGTKKMKGETGKQL